jgi:prephenate dehydratase
VTSSQNSPRIAFQGERGAFSEEAVIKLAGENIQLVPRPTFGALFSAIPEGAADFALAPLENTLAGSVHQSYDLLLESSLHIVAEVAIPIAHNLIGCPSATLAGIRIVYSHPVALAQCLRFFLEHPEIQPIAANDTAGSVRQIIEKGDLSRAAIAGRRAAEYYGGVILLENLQDYPENYTRFVLLSAKPEMRPGANKISLVIRVKHQPGALYSALGVFAKRGISLLKIESRPLKGTPWHYSFYLDIEGSTADSTIVEALAELGDRAEWHRILGCYPAAKSAAEAHASAHSKPYFPT